MNLQVISAKTLFIAFLLVVIAVPVYAFEQPEEHYYRGKVLKVTEVETEDPYDLGRGEQIVQVKISSGPYKGRVIEVQNYYISHDPMYSLHVEKGMQVILVDMGGTLENVHLQDLARDRGVFVLGAIFVMLIIALARFKGIKTVISLALTGILIFRVFIPNLLQGHNPILLAIAVAGAAIVLTLLLVSGINVKSLSAMIGTLSGMAAAGLLAIWSGQIAYLTGFNTHEAQALHYMDFTLNMKGILFAGIIIGSIGAITDVGISIASAAAEVVRANPRIGFKELTASALNVGRDIICTMANTLILAYVGVATPLFLLVVGNNIGWLKIINLDLVATELVRGLVGSIGLIIAVPITAVAAGLLMRRKNLDMEEKSEFF